MAAAEAIRTTDTARKVATAPVGQSGAVVGGMAKGAQAMLSPNMATMLAVLTTDAEATNDELREILRGAVSTSFNVLMTDACRSTNDARDPAGQWPGRTGRQPRAGQGCGAGLRRPRRADGGRRRGATKVVKLTVTGAASDADAGAGARQTVASALCKGSWFGQDLYWGRLASELGVAGIEMDQEQVAVAYGGVTAAAGGITVDHDEAAVAEHMAQRAIPSTSCATCGLGSGTFTVLTNDLAPRVHRREHRRILSGVNGVA
ncbi:MAG: bifunctional ornithine acetyltransferase/N-acetylglutamate synthase [Acidimicrobiales bacterium]